VKTRVTTIATDNFNRANGHLGTHWKIVAGNSAPQILSLQVHPGAVGQDSYAYYRGARWSADQWALITLKTSVGAFGKAAGPIVRASPSANTMYLFHAEGVIGGGTTVLEIRKCLAGVYTTLATTGEHASVNTGDVLYLQVIGSVLTAKHNGVIVLVANDKTIVGGNAGIGVFSDTGAVEDAALSDFVGGNF
jgi:hypothetical protein